MSVSTILTSTRTISAIACSLSLAAMAATPVAVWDGDFTATQTGFTLNRSGNAISQDNSTITIDQSVGVKVDFTTGLSDAMTVMFKYSDLALNAQKTNTLATSFCSGGDENRTGVYAASGGTINGIWNTADWAHPAQTLSASSGVLAFCYSKTAGTSLYSVGASSRNELFNESGLKAGNDTAINGCTIGGERAKSGATLLGAATGMKITGIAIFDGILTEAEMTGYEWPSDGATVIKADTTVSDINTQVGSASEIKLLLLPGVTITMDDPFVADTVKLVSLGSIALKADAQPSEEELAKFDLSGARGAVKRSWLGPDVIGYNFCSDGYNYSYFYGGAADTSSALATGAWYANGQAKAGTEKVYLDGLTTLSWSAPSVWSEGTGISKGTFIQGYLDDNGGSPVVEVSALPFESYDVIIYCSAGSEGAKFQAKYVNGHYYKWDAETGATVIATGAGDNWGSAKTSVTPVYGTNCIRVNNLSGPLTIRGGQRNSNLGGGCVSAIQIIPADVEIDATNGFVADATRTANIRKDYREVTIFGSEGKGATIDFGNSFATFTSHVVFDGGTHTLNYQNPNNSASFNNPSAPVIETRNGAIVNFTTKDLTGWTGAATAKVPYSNIKVGEGTVLNFTPNAGSNTFYYQGRITLEPGATLNSHYTSGDLFRMNGGAVEGYEQIYVPESLQGSEHAVIDGAEGNTGLFFPESATKGLGVFVGENSTLDMNLAVKSADSGAPLGKWGDGTLNLNGNMSGYKGTLTIHEGTVNVGTATTLTNVVNDGTLAFAYGATISTYSGAGNVVVDVSPLVSDGAIASGSYTLLPGAAVDPGNVEVTGLPEESGFSVQFTSEGIVLTDEDVFSSVWTGGSGNWTDGQFDGRTGSTEGLPVLFANSENSDVAVLVTGDKSVVSMGFVADDTAYTLSGDQITTTEGIAVSGVAPVVISNKVVVGGSVVLNAGTELTLATDDVSLTSGALSGSGTLVLDPGEGNEFTMSTANTSFTGEAVIASGTVKMGDAQSFGVVTKDGVIRVKGGATFDANHAGATTTYYAENGHKLGLVLESGATFASSTQNDDRKLSAVSSLTLEGDATVDATTADVSIALHLNWDYTHINLGANTLRKKGNNTFSLSACKIDGTGVFHVEEGSVTICNSYYGTRAGLFTEGTLRLDSGTYFNMTHYYTSGKYPVFTVKNLELNGIVTRQAGTDATNSTLTVTGYVTGNGTTPMLTLAEGAVFKPTGTGYLTITESLILPSVLTNDVSGVDFDSASTVPLFKVGLPEMLPEAENMAFSCGELPKRWSLKKTSDGLGYRLKKEMSFSILLR